MAHILHIDIDGLRKLLDGCGNSEKHILDCGNCGAHDGCCSAYPCAEARESDCEEDPVMRSDFFDAALLDEDDPFPLDELLKGPADAPVGEWVKEFATVDRLLCGVRIISNAKKRATTVMWGDGTVTVVRATKGEKMSNYHAFTAAFTKRLIGSNSQICKIVDATTKLGKTQKKKP